MGVVKVVQSEKRKKKRSKWVNYSIGVVVLLAIMGGSLVIYKHFIIKANNDSFVTETKEGEILDETGKESIDYSFWNEDRTVSTMHKMTHQKVYASDKWGAVEMTNDRVNRLYEIVKNSSFTNKDILLGILGKWKAGDFSMVDKDHNYFWKYQDGNVGEATGIMTAEDEQSFIESTFKQTQSDAEE